jgi:hypothetical protein
MCYNSKLYEDVAEVKLVVMMGSRLMIVMFQNNDIQNREINTARKLKIPILFIYNSENDKKNHKVKPGEDQIVFQNLTNVEVELKDRFKLKNDINKRKNLPFKTLESKTELFEFTKIDSILILKEKNKLIVVGDKIQSYNTNFFNSTQNIQIFEFKNGQINACVNNKDEAIVRENIRIREYVLHSVTLEAIRSYESKEGRLNACVDNKDKEIIILTNRVFSKYNFDFVRLPEDEDKILKVEDIINEIIVNEENKHVYGISNSSHKLFHFDKEFKLIQTMKITTPLLIKVLNNNLYMLLNAFRNSNIEGSHTAQIIEKEKSFIGVYSQKENEVIKFKRKIILDVLVAPTDFHVDENYLFIFTDYINKCQLIYPYSHLFILSHDGILLQKTGLNISSHLNTRFLVVDNQTIYCADYKMKTFKRLEFQKYHSEDDENI